MTSHVSARRRILSKRHHCDCIKHGGDYRGLSGQDRPYCLASSTANVADSYALDWISFDTCYYGCGSYVSIRSGLLK